MNNIDYLNKFLLTSKIEKNLSPRTIKAYGCDLRAFIASIDCKCLTSLTIDHCREYLVYLGNKDISEATIKRKIATIKVFFNFMEEEGYVKISPVRKLKKKYRISRKLPRVMSIQEIEGLLRAAYRATLNSVNESDFRQFKRFRDRVILELLFVVGIRIDELVKINIADLDLEAKTLFILGKGKKERLLYISSNEVIEVINSYLIHRNKYGFNKQPLFLNKYSNRLSVYSIRDIFKEYYDLAGIKRKFTPHCLRHSMATMLMENGADIRSVQEILGHSAISTTEIYLAVSKRRKEAVLSKFNQRNSLRIAN